MRIWACWLATGWVSLVTARGADVFGTVHAEGKEGADNPALGGKYDSRKYKFAERVNYAEMHDFVVSIEGSLRTNFVVVAPPVQVVRTLRVEQRGATFSPHVLPVMVGTTVEWPNQDDIVHNVFSYSDAKPFDLGLYKSPESKRVTFDRLGRVDVFCSIHKQMNCIVLVLENPFFAVSDERGRYRISHVPPGTYKFKAWHERMPSQVSELTVPESGEVKLDFTLGLKVLPSL